MMSLYQDDMADLFGEDNFYPSDDDRPNTGQTESNAENQPQGEEQPESNEQQSAKKEAKTKRVVKNPQPKLDPDRLCGPRGISKIPEFFADVKLKGKGHEKEDLDLVLKKLEHWSHRLFPKLPFDDCLGRIEKIGIKKSVQTYVKKIRMDMIETSAEHISEEAPSPLPDSSEDVFNSLFRSVGPSSETNNDLGLPTPEQRQRMEENRRKAEERKQARQQQKLSTRTGDISQESNDDSRSNPAIRFGDSAAAAEPDDDLVDIDSMLEEFND